MLSKFGYLSDSYYDLETNSCGNGVKTLIYPGILSKAYSITKDGIVYSFINDNYISWSIRNGKPYVNLSCKGSSGAIILEPFYIKDLVAYNYIANADSYLERGYYSTNIDGNSMNCNYLNILYIHSNIPQK